MFVLDVGFKFVVLVCEVVLWNVYVVLGIEGWENYCVFEFGFEE